MPSDVLTDAAIRKFAPGAKPTRRFDGRGLCLEVTPAGGRWRRLKYRVGGKAKLLSLGTDPDTTLRQARQRRDKARALLASGIDPSAARKASRLSQGGVSANAFESVAREFHETKQSEWSEPHARRWLERLKQDVFPYLGGQVLTEITAPMLLEALRRATKASHSPVQH